MSADRLVLLGVRHHGPGSAHAVRQALDAVNPGVVLVEGPPEGSALVPHVARGLRPPVALLAYVADAPDVAWFYPFAAWSPEWVALQWAVARGRPVRFVDLPLERREPERPPTPTPTEAPPDPDAGGETEPESDAGDPDVAGPDTASFDPIGALAAADGEDDGDAWWDRVIEANANGVEIFQAIEAAMSELRGPEAAASGPREAAREASMRLGAAEALAETDQPVVFVCGAWHTPALRRPPTDDDRRLVAALPRRKVEITWVPWSDTRLGAASGYGAGVAAPAWYDHVARCLDAADGGPLDPEGLAVGWLAAAARVMRRAGRPVSTAQVIDATATAVALCGVRDRALPGLPELWDAARAVFAGGEDAPLDAVVTELVVGVGVGDVGEEVPQNPLQVDLDRQAKRLRLVRTAANEELSVDLRSDAGRAKSTLLHRLTLLGVPWGRLVDAGRSRGTFREKWTLRWEPELSVRLVEAVAFGTTVEAASSARARSDLDALPLPGLADRVMLCLVADLVDAAHLVAAALQARAATQSDTASVVDALPALVDALRYGSARDVSDVALGELVDRLVEQALVGVSVAVRGLDDEEAAHWHRRLDRLDHAVHIEDRGHADAWARVMARLASDDGVAPRVAGAAARALHDRGRAPPGDVAGWLARGVARSAPPKDAAAWIEGFVARSGEVLLLDAGLRGLIDAWLVEIPEDAWPELLPMLRRAFSSLDAMLRRRLLDAATGRARRSAGPERLDVGDASFIAALPLLAAILGDP